MIKPYYENMHGKLYCGDCLVVMQELIAEGVKVDCVVTDPPYGIDYGRAGRFCATHGWGKWRENVEWDKERPAAEYFQAMLSASKNVIIWGGNYFTDVLPPSMQWLVWDKGQRNFSLADCEFAWSSQQKAARIFNYPRGAAVKDGKVHPTQKPLRVMQWCIKQLPADCQTILDPFAGSGTTLVAAQSLGRKWIGIEISPDYCAIAVKRLEGTIRQLEGQENMFKRGGG